MGKNLIIISLTTFARVGDWIFAMNVNYFVGDKLVIRNSFRYSRLI